jgi:hypothetical protein
MDDKMQKQAKNAVSGYLASQATATPGRDVPYGEVVQKLKHNGYSEGAIFEAWSTLKQLRAKHT